MREDSVRAFCPVCKHRQTFERGHVNHVLHLVLSVITLGLWLVSWVAVVIGSRCWPWSCTQCGWRLSRLSFAKEKKKTTQVIASEEKKN
jgi:hypothetical protein